MSKKRKAQRILKRKPRNWLGIICVLFSLGALALGSYEEDAEGKVTNPAQIFAAFADLNVGADAVLRMRTSPAAPSRAPLGNRWRVITAVLDGDTVKLDSGETVRLIGVDTPETENNRKLREDIYRMAIPVREKDLMRLGAAASRFTEQMAIGQQCWLEFEKEQRDQYGRMLAYVHLRDGRILNEEIVYNGYGRAYIGMPFSYKKRYILLQADASLNKRGLWRPQE